MREMLELKCNTIEEDFIRFHKLSKDAYNVSISVCFKDRDPEVMLEDKDIENLISFLKEKLSEEGKNK